TGQRTPSVGFTQVALHADAASVEDGEIVLAVADAVGGGLAEPLRRHLVVGLAVDALGIEHREIVHGLGVALAGGAQVVAAGGLKVLLDAFAPLVQAAEAEQRGYEAC